MQKQHAISTELYTAEGLESRQQAQADLARPDPDADEAAKILKEAARDPNAPTPPVE